MSEIIFEFEKLPFEVFEFPDNKGFKLVFDNKDKFYTFAESIRKTRKKLKEKDYDEDQEKARNKEFDDLIKDIKHTYGDILPKVQQLMLEINSKADFTFVFAANSPVSYIKASNDSISVEAVDYRLMDVLFKYNFVTQAFNDQIFLSTFGNNFLEYLGVIKK